MEICTVGGYEEVGKNMTAVKFGEDVILLDAGIFLPAVMELQEDETQQANAGSLRRIGALPDDLVLDKLGWRKKVKAIIIGHAHLDHVGAVPYLADRYPNAEILGTPFTMAVLESILKDEKIQLSNKRKVVRANTTYTVKGTSEDYKIEFIHTTHSTIQCVFLYIKSEKEKKSMFYALDFKFDNFPTMGAPPNYKRLKELGKAGVDVLVVDSLYSGTDRRTASERIAKNLLEDAMGSVQHTKNAILVTTFSSHIARLNSIVEFAKRTKREIIFLGRSLNKYVNCAVQVKECPFIKSVKMMKYRRQINSFLRRASQEPHKYLIVCTGHQGEPGSILDRIVNNETPFVFKNGDNVIFSSSVIPTPVNIAAREKLDAKLRKKGVRIQTDVHVSGHGGREDLRDLVEMLKPKHVIPAHGTLKQETPMIELSTELGYKFGHTSHLSHNGKVLEFK